MLHFTTAEKVYQASQDELCEAGCSTEVVKQITTMKESYNFDQEMKIFVKEEIQLVAYNDEQYPISLTELFDMPYLLYCKGDVSLLLDNFGIAIVGSRSMSTYGLGALKYLIPEIVTAGLTVVSGLALGIDGAAHELTLNAKGRTLAVLGTGIDTTSIYPRQHYSLAQRIIQEGGLVISEFAPGTKGLKFNFPLRNRIISGLTMGTFVVEAKMRSGSLITAQTALDQEKEVFALPGSIFYPLNRGTHKLIQDGAHLVGSAQDILQKLPVSNISMLRKVRKEFQLTDTEKKVLASLDTEKTLDELVESSKLPIGEVSSLVTLLEIKGVVRKMGEKVVKCSM